jgi:superfamily II DNA/RNA helicase
MALFYSDVEDVKFVINFDYPQSSEDYVHRIGRTGRSQRTGTAYAFFTPSNAKQANDLIAVLQEANQVINPKLHEMAQMARSGAFGRRSECNSTLNVSVLWINVVTFCSFVELIQLMVFLC